MNDDCVVSATPSTQALHYRSFTPADIPTAHALSMTFNWPHRPEDWQFAVEQGTGFVAAENGVVIGTALCWKYGTDRGSLGLVIVSPEHQGRGIGRKLMELVLEELGPRITFLHATPAGRPLYEKLGFNVCDSLDQYQGNVGETLPVTLPDDERLRPATTADFPALIELATRASGLERKTMVSALLEMGETVVLERDSEIIGFSILRRFGRGQVIGPMVAMRSPDDLRAKALIGYWLNGREGQFIRIDVPCGASLADWLVAQGPKCVDTTVKMVRNAPAVAHQGAPDPVYRLYGLISQAMF
ncbi:ribosomal protein S18 acetylase RimI-like enzyme [Paraburkholderia sp. RAU2J]|uniref:GNAT family N-acetyltransferase n=1 Tax=Paraburkholderia sp. RAU2J TaxID=1938810 RepID=UPI000EABF4C8|nr:GNAT family N-acetyltransferase [Paraburkholderia sp. RAU2J]RKT13630.1 ribosomal protein S18 acetylase RimI-like enzyme [Paraburkholderia sp. RAU2J]